MSYRRPETLIFIPCVRWPPSATSGSTSTTERLKKSGGRSIIGLSVSAGTEHELQIRLGDGPRTDNGPRAVGLIPAQVDHCRRGSRQLAPIHDEIRAAADRRW